MIYFVKYSFVNTHRGFIFPLKDRRGIIGENIMAGAENWKEKINLTEKKMFCFNRDIERLDILVRDYMNSWHFSTSK